MHQETQTTTLLVNRLNTYRPIKVHPFFNFVTRSHTYKNKPHVFLLQLKMSANNKPSDSHSLVLPWKTWISVSALSVVTDAFCRSDSTSTINCRIFSLFDVKASPNPNTVKGVKYLLWIGG